MSNISSNTIQLHYVEWDPVHLKELGVISDWSITRDYMFVCKLTDAVIIRNRLWEHVSHETNRQQEAAIYIRSFEVAELVSYRQSIEHAIFQGQCQAADKFTVEWHLWREHSFQLVSSFQPEEALEAAALLLDHYSFVGETEVEMLLTILDTDRNTLLLFAKIASS